MNSTKGLLMRVGIDQTYGKYNAPINPETNDYLYIPIPDKNEDKTTYHQIKPHFNAWVKRNNAVIEFPYHLEQMGGCHLDPDFDYLTYGDQGENTGRGRRVATLNKGDFIAFFASFNPIKKCSHSLVYALYGIMFVDKVMKAKNVSVEDLNKNAHTRLVDVNGEHLIVYADPLISGRFDKAIPIGEFRRKSYRMTKEMEKKWGGIDVYDGYIQRSVNPPWFVDPKTFLTWFETQNVKLIASNWGV